MTGVCRGTRPDRRFRRSAEYTTPDRPLTFGTNLTPPLRSGTVLRMVPHPISTTAAPSPAGDSALRLLLPLILSLLPWLILQAELPDARSRQSADARRQWLERARLISRRLPEVTTFNHWIEEATARLTRRIERRLLAVPGLDEARLLSITPAIDAEFERRPLREVPIPQVWISVFPQKDGKSDLSAAPQLLKGPHLESSYRAVFANLLRDVAREQQGVPSGIHSQSVMNRLQQSLGDGVSARSFDPAQEGRAFDAIWQSRYVLAVWRLLRVRGNVVGGALFLYTIGEERYELALRSALRNWRTLFAEAEMVPVFLPIPTHPGRSPSPPLALSRLPDRPARHLVDSVRRELRVRLRRFSGGSSQVGRVDLPLLEMTTGRQKDDWMALPCALAPMSGYLGLLLGRIPPGPPLLLEGIARFYGILLIIGWGGFLALASTGRRLPLPDVRTTFLLWFIALAGTPVSLMITAGERLQFDLASNRRTALDEELARTLRRAEIDSLQGTNEFRLLAHRLTTSPRFLWWVRRVHRNERLQKRFLDHLFTVFKRRHLELFSVILMAPQRISFSRFSSAIAPDLASSVVSFQQIFTTPLLNRPGAAEIFNDEASGFSEAAGEGKEYAKGSPAQMLIGNFNFVNSPDTLARARLGNRQSLRYYNIFRLHNRDILFTIFDCGIDRTYEVFIRRALHELHLKNRSLFFAVYRKTPDGVAPIVETGDRDGLMRIRRDLKPWGLVAEADGERRFIFTSRRMPEYIFVAGTSLAPLQSWLFAQAGGIVLALFISLAFLAGCAWTLARWLVPPITEMTDGLKRVAANDLQIHLDDDRADEIGQACRALNSMTERLRERQMMSRFVAPQVLEVVADGDIDRACAGSERDVALLVSDIRSFTTLSETHPPTEIFDLLNRHFQAMTPIIQRNGGAIDRFIGDAVQAVFYAGLHGDPASRALQAAIEMRQEHDRLCQARRRDCRFAYEIGIGLESGKVVTGVLGDPEVRLDFTVLGEAMKNAAELESLSRYGSASRIVVSPGFRARLAGNPVFKPISEESSSPSAPAWEYAGIDVPTSDTVPTMKAKPPGDTPRHEVQAPSFPPRSLALKPATPSNRGFAADVRLFVLAWTLPVLLAAWAFSALLGDEARRREESIGSRLDDDLSMVEHSLEPRTLALDHIRRRLNPALHQHPATLPFQGLEQDLQTRFRALENDFPGFGWGIFAVATAANPIRPTPADFQHPGLISKGGAFPAIKPLVLDSWFRELMMTLGMPVVSNRDSRLEGVGKDLLGKTRFNQQQQQAWGNFVDLPLYGKPRLFCWFPIVSREYSEHLSSISNRHRPRTRAWELLISHIRGVVFLFLPAETIDQPDGLKRLIPLIAQSGGRLALLPHRQKAAGGWWHHDFQRDPELRSLLHAWRRGTLDRMRPRNWRITTGEVVQNERWTVLLARPLGKGGQRVSQLITGLTVLGGAWFLLGLFGISRRFFPTTDPWSLRKLLTTAFALSLLPTFTLGLLVLERASLEQRSRAVTEQRRRLADTVQAADEGRQMLLGWGASLMSRNLNATGTLSDLEAIAQGLPSASGKLPEQWVQEFYWRVADHGLRILGPMFSDHRTGKKHLLVEVIRGRNSETRYWRHIFRFSNALALQRLGPFVDSQKGDPKMEIMADEMRSLLRVLFPPEHLAELLSGPRSISDFTFFSHEQEYILRWYLTHRGKQRFSFLASLPPNSFDIPLLRTWHARRVRENPDHVWLSASPARDPERCYHPPIVRYKRMSNGELGFNASYDTQHPQIIDLTRRAIRRECGVYGTIGSARGLQLCLSQPGIISANLHFNASVQLGELLHLIDRARSIRLLVLSMVGVLLLILGRKVAGRFLQPVLQLDAAAHRITTGDVTPRLPLDGAREFLDLAVAFNAMAQGVAEGKLLSRFVSDSVRTAARDRDRHFAALAGQGLEATILFAGLDGYQRMLTKLPPERLIAVTNIYLQRLSAVIRRHGGEIDKFIGDKILAVFPVERFGSREAAALAGIATADDLLLAMIGLDDTLSLPLGIGLVTGPVLAGIVGSPEVRLEYTVIGDTVNLASRLCDVAQRLTRQASRPAVWSGQPGGIVIEKATAAAVETAHGRVHEGRFEPLALPPIKGKTHAVETLLVRPRVPTPR